MNTPRTYEYIRALVKRANAASSVQHMIKNHQGRLAFEKKHAEEIAAGWKILEEQASRGAIRLFFHEHPLFEKPEIQTYFQSKGFSFSEKTVEWWYEKKEVELR